MRYLSLICVVCVLLSFAPVRAGEDGTIEVKGGEGSAVLSFTDGRAEVNTKGDHEITATLPSNPTTGYRWQLMNPLSGDTVKLVSNTYHPSRPGLIGGGGQEIWIFRTGAPGEAEIVLAYLRSWEKGIPPALTRTIKLRVSP
jgi:inhibitor of cysteine peptidase